jgi:hypothetical protein
MKDEERVEIRLVVEKAGDPISGTVHDSRGDTRDFLGWLQLMAAVDDARSTLHRDRSAR